MREIPRDYYHPYCHRLLRSFQNLFYLIPSLSSQYLPFASESFSDFLGSLSSLLLLKFPLEMVLIGKLVMQLEEE